MEHLDCVPQRPRTFRGSDFRRVRNLGRRVLLRRPLARKSRPDPARAGDCLDGGLIPRAGDCPDGGLIPRAARRKAHAMGLSETPMPWAFRLSQIEKAKSAQKAPNPSTPIAKPDPNHPNTLNRTPETRHQPPKTRPQPPQNPQNQPPFGQNDPQNWQKSTPKDPSKRL